MKKLLFVDDATSMRKLISMVLGEEFDLTIAIDGEDGLKCVNEQQFDAIISDVNMPKMDGITFLKKVRELENYKFTPILMMTTEASPEMKAQGKANGATGWLVKPFDPDKLPKMVHKLVD